MSTPEGLKFTETHEWAKVEGDIVTIGITHYAAEQLGDLVFIELPEVGAEVSQGESCGTIESVKTAADLYSPVTGEVIEVNESVSDALEKVSKDPYGEGWLAKIKITDTSQLDKLMDSSRYEEYLKTVEH